MSVQASDLKDSVVAKLVDDRHAEWEAGQPLGDDAALWDYLASLDQASRLRVSGFPPERLTRWLDGMNSAVLMGMRTLDDIEKWTSRVETTMELSSGRTPVALRKAFPSGRWFPAQWLRP